jgi:hypothetical protein
VAVRPDDVVEQESVERADVVRGADDDPGVGGDGVHFLDGDVGVGGERDAAPAGGGGSREP